MRSTESLLERFISERSLYSILLDALKDRPPDREPKEFIQEFLRARYSYIFQGEEATLAALLKSIALLKSSKAEALALATAVLLRNKLLSSMPQHLLLARHAEQEGRERSDFLAKHSFTPLNDIFSFDIYGNEARIHFAPARAEQDQEIKRRFAEAMQALALHVDLSKDIEVVTATSWIIGRAPRIIERLGFSIQGVIKEEERLLWFPNETRPVYKAIILRLDFLDRYLARA